MHFEYLNAHHNKSAFDCGNDDINHYLKTMASQHHKRGVARVHILADETTIIGFFTLTNTMMDNSNLLIKRCPKQIPAILIGRIGVDKTYQGQGFSKLLLSNALKKIKSMSLDSGIMFAIVDAKNDGLANYYQQYGFVPTDMPNRLIYDIGKLELKP